MSWFVWIFGFVVVLGASQLARFKGYDDTKVSAILLAGLIGAIGYSFIGRAELADQPYADRTAELAARDPLTLSAGERFQKWPQIYSNTLQNVTLFSTVTSISLYLIERGQLEQKVTSVTPIILSRNI